MEWSTKVQILDEAVYASLYANTLEELWVNLFKPQLWVNNQVDLFLWPYLGN